MITLWQGSANQWDCDEMGHMNVRIYVEKAIEGLGVFAKAIHMPQAFASAGQSTLIPVDQHIRYIREAHAGHPLSMQACVLEIGDCDVLLYQEIRHSNGQPAAAFRTRLIHAQSKNASPFPWSTRTRAALETLIDTPPPATAPRSIAADASTLPPHAITREAALASKAPRIGIGTVPAHHCDLNGRMRTEWFMGRLSDCVPNLLYDWRQTIAKSAGDVRTGAAVLEYRLVYHAYPKAGDTFEIYSSFASAADKVHALVHWMINPQTGNPWMSCEAVALTFDLDTRKALKPEPAHIDLLKTLAPHGLKV